MNPPPPITQRHARINALSSSAARGFHALNIRNFRLFWIGQLISLTGTWMQTTAQAWLVLKLSQDSPFALGLVITLQFLPVMLFALFGGVLADHLPKRRALIITQTLLLLQAGIFGGLVAANLIQMWHIYLLAMTQGLITAIDNPIRQSFLFEMVGRDDLVNAIGLNSMTFQGARIFGPAAAGILINLIGIAPALISNAVSFIPVIWALFLMNPAQLHTAPPAEAGSVFERLREGLRFAFRTPTVLAILLVAAFLGTFGYNFTVIVPLVADTILKTDASGYGFLSAAMGVGALLAATGTAYASSIGMRRMLISGAVFSVFLGLLALSRVFWLSVVILIIVAIAGITCATATNSLLQLNTPDQLRGRVLSINVLLTQGSTPIGGFILGTLGQVAGVPMAIIVCAALCLLGVGIAYSYYRRLLVAPPEPI